LLRRGIEPIIAVVILVAVTLVIAIGVIGWIMGWWGTFGATESIQFFPDSNIAIAATGTNLYLHAKNTGSASAIIYKIEVLGIDSATISTVINVNPTGSVSISDGEVTMAPGGEATIVCSLGNAVAGAKYQVKIYTRAGNVYSVTVEARLASG